MTSCVQTYIIFSANADRPGGASSPNWVPIRLYQPEGEIQNHRSGRNGRRTHTPEMTAANFHRPPTRTADAAQHKRHESEEDYTRPLPRDHMGSPTPTSIGLVPANRVFFFTKCRTTKHLGTCKYRQKHAGQAKMPDEKKPGSL